MTLEGVGDRGALLWHRVGFICPGVSPQQWVNVVPAAVQTPQKGQPWGRRSLFLKEMVHNSIRGGWGIQGWIRCENPVVL